VAPYWEEALRAAGKVFGEKGVRLKALCKKNAQMQDTFVHKKSVEGIGGVLGLKKLIDC
jgi:hypothetical protein